MIEVTIITISTVAELEETIAVECTIISALPLCSPISLTEYLDRTTFALHGKSNLISVFRNLGTRKWCITSIPSDSVCYCRLSATVTDNPKSLTVLISSL